jgi:pilus assembly protein CpaF
VFGKRSVSSSPAPVAVKSPTLAPATPKQHAEAPESGRTPFPSAGLGAPIVGAPTKKPLAGPATPPPEIPTAVDSRRPETYYETKGTVFSALIEAIDLGQLDKLDAESARE